jgi:hypothetical protein
MKQQIKKKRHLKNVDLKKKENQIWHKKKKNQIIRDEIG